MTAEAAQAMAAFINTPGHEYALGGFFGTLMYAIEQRYREVWYGGGCTYPGDQDWDDVGADGLA